MIRATALLVFVTALTLLAATGCSKSSDAVNPKAETPKDRPVLQPVKPAGAPGAPGANKGPAPSPQ